MTLLEFINILGKTIVTAGAFTLLAICLFILLSLIQSIPEFLQAMVLVAILAAAIGYGLGWLLEQLISWTIAPYTALAFAVLCPVTIMAAIHFDSAPKSRTNS